MRPLLSRSCLPRLSCASLAFLCRTFDVNDVYTGSKQQAIPEETIFELDPTSGSEVARWGGHLFFMPHGLSIDSKGNYWITDVALHQVFKFGADRNGTPLLTLGQRFMPGAGQQRFCKPTSVAVHAQTGDVFVADGYCNSRLIRFSSTGHFLNSWGHAGFEAVQGDSLNFAVPHKVVLIEEQRVACVSDRENGKITCLDVSSEATRVTASIAKKSEWPTLYSITYARCSPVNMLFAVNGPSRRLFEPHQPIMAFGIDYKERKIITRMAPQTAAQKIPSVSAPFLFPRQP